MIAETWRVVDDAGVLLWAGVPQPMPQADGSTRWSADGAGSWASQWWAVLAMAAHRHLDAAQILAPGALTADERVAAEREACAVVCDARAVALDGEADAADDPNDGDDLEEADALRCARDEADKLAAAIRARGAL